MTLDQLKAAEARLVRALGDPTKTVFYDEFKRENRPSAEIEDALRAIRREISAHADNATPPSRSVIRPVRMSGAY